MRTDKLLPLAGLILAVIFAHPAQADRIYYKVDGHRYWCRVQSPCGQALIQQEQERAKAAQQSTVQRILGIKPDAPPPRYEVVAGPGQAAPPISTSAPSAAQADGQTQTAALAPAQAPAQAAPAQAAPAQVAPALPPARSSRAARRDAKEAREGVPLPPRRQVAFSEAPIVVATGSITGVLPARSAAVERNLPALETWDRFAFHHSAKISMVRRLSATRSRETSFHEAVAMGNGARPAATRFDAWLEAVPERTSWPLNGTVGALLWR